MVAPKGRPNVRAGGAQQTAMMENDVVAMEQRLAALLYEAVAVDEPSSGLDLRSSSAGRFVSMTLDLPMQSGSDVLRIYRLIKDQPEVISYF